MRINYSLTQARSNSYFSESLDIPQSSNSEAAFRPASKWLEHCVENHEACRSGQVGFMPKRLLKISSTPVGGVVLVESSPLAGATPYVALNYC